MMRINSSFLLFIFISFICLFPIFSLCQFAPSPFPSPTPYSPSPYSSTPYPTPSPYPSSYPPLPEWMDPNHQAKQIANQQAILQNQLSIDAIHSVNQQQYAANMKSYQIKANFDEQLRRQQVDTVQAIKSNYDEQQYANEALEQSKQEQLRIQALQQDQAKQHAQKMGESVNIVNEQQQKTIIAQHQANTAQVDAQVQDKVTRDLLNEANQSINNLIQANTIHLSLSPEMQARTAAMLRQQKLQEQTEKMNADVNMRSQSISSGIALAASQQAQQKAQFELKQQMAKNKGLVNQMQQAHNAIGQGGLYQQQPPPQPPTPTPDQQQQTQQTGNEAEFDSMEDEEQDDNSSEFDEAQDSSSSSSSSPVYTSVDLINYIDKRINDFTNQLSSSSSSEEKSIINQKLVFLNQKKQELLNNNNNNKNSVVSSEKVINPSLESELLLVDEKIKELEGNINRSNNQVNKWINTGKLENLQKRKQQLTENNQFSIDGGRKEGQEGNAAHEIYEEQQESEQSSSFSISLSIEQQQRRDVLLEALSHPDFQKAIVASLLQDDGEQQNNNSEFDSVEGEDESESSLNHEDVKLLESWVNEIDEVDQDNTDNTNTAEFNSVGSSSSSSSSSRSELESSLLKALSHPSVQMELVDFLLQEEEEEEKQGNQAQFDSVQEESKKSSSSSSSLLNSDELSSIENWLVKNRDSSASQSSINQNNRKNSVNSVEEEEDEDNNENNDNSAEFDSLIASPVAHSPVPTVIFSPNHPSSPFYQYQQVQADIQLVQQYLAVTPEGTPERFQLLSRLHTDNEQLQMLYVHMQNEHLSYQQYEQPKPGITMALSEKIIIDRDINANTASSSPSSSSSSPSPILIPSSHNHHSSYSSPSHLYTHLLWSLGIGLVLVLLISLLFYYLRNRLMEKKERNELEMARKAAQKGDLPLPYSSPINNKYYNQWNQPLRIV